MRYLLKLLGHECPKPGPAVIPYSRAVLCLSCDKVTESTNDHCIACAAPGCYLIHLANREIHRAKGI
jgi:hypothetical protein